MFRSLSPAWCVLNEQSFSQTDLSLLERMDDSRFRSRAWKEFLHRYTRLFYAWFHRWGVEPQSMDDVLQETILRVLGNLKSFDHRRHGSFRAWLKTLANSSWKQLVADTTRQLAQRQANPLRAASWLQQESSVAEDSLMLLFDEWATEEILNMAQSRVEQRIDPETWATYRMVVLEERLVESVIEQSGIAAGTVYSRLFRVRRMLQEEMAELDGPAK